MNWPVVLVVVLLSTACASAGDWPQWRGIHGSGVASDVKLPERWSATENIRWKVSLPGRGVSGPVVVDDRVYLTASSAFRSERLHVLSFDLGSGRLLWERQLWATNSTQCHEKTCPAAPTPVTDGERVVALFGTFDLVCFDRSGTLLWYRSLGRDYPDVNNQVGFATSPILWEDGLFVALETESEAFLLAIDKRTGLNRWKTPRPKTLTWATPLVLQSPDGVELVLQSLFGLSAYDPVTGAVRWEYDGKIDSIPSPVSSGGAVFAGGPMHAVEPGASERPAKLRWKSQQLSASTASPLVYRGRVYGVNSAGVLACGNVADGSVLWKERLEGPFSASPVAGDGKLYYVNETGLTTVVNTEGSERIIATNNLGETLLASPAIAGGALLLRSDRHLFCIGSRADEKR
jgi:outer membrane protein assembly factor BamB